jgi:NADPH:quinone reductase-like Zn-dependent oxidoreductase
MKACVFDTPSESNDVLHVLDVPIPTPGEGELLVRIEASPIQPSDFMFIAGRYRMKPVPSQVAGLEGCGIVVHGKNAGGFAEGTRVTFRHPGCWAEYNVVPAIKAVRVPEGIGAESASQFSLNPVTAWALLHECHASEGDWIAVNAASSTVAGLVRALAADMGIQTVGIFRGSPPESSGPAASADASDLADALRVATGGRPLAALLDAVGGLGMTRVVPALAPGAVIVSYGMLGGEPALVGNGDLIYRNLTWKGFGIDRWMAHHQAELPAMTHRLWRAISTGALPLPVRTTYGLHQVQEALATAVKAAGKVLLVPAASR